MNKKFDISKFNPCDEGKNFYNAHDDFKTAWETCPRGDWMLWISTKLNVNIHKLFTAKYLCANTVKHLMKDERSLKALEASKLFGQKKIGKAKLKQAADAAADAAAAADDARRKFNLPYWCRWYVRPRSVLYRNARWVLVGMEQPSPWEPLVEMFRLGCLPIGYVRGEFVIYCPKPPRV